MKVPFLDLQAQYREVKKDVNSALRRIFRRSDFILGEEERLFEREFARYCGRKFGIGVNSGTDALILSLRAMGIGAGDEVIVPAFTFIATASSVSLAGATPVFVDVDEQTLNIDAGRIERALTKKTRAVIPVHLFGQPADMIPLLKIARKHNLKVIEDAAQAHGALYYEGGKGKARGAGRKTGSMGDAGCFSFYPTKNLGGAGDGGMIVLDDERLYQRLIMLRDNGRKSRYEHRIIGYNSRLDTLQAAVLGSKLKRLDAWNDRRRICARMYTDLLQDISGVNVFDESDYARHVYHIYCMRTPDRDGLVGHLKKNGVGVMVHYPIPLHLQEAYRFLGYKRGDFPAAEKAAKEIISLPMHPFLKNSQIRFVVSLIKQYATAGGVHAR
ncbi:MAG: DegT/DnrJ/EryC1/StrS family aminotransferase [Candidatus Omnitrophica bacterium]|nr:DegT/DnrJ/EryC1/StrS family aminotransferase [Candidatus Omnitrophota bacterium]